VKYILAFLFILFCSGCTPVALNYGTLHAPNEPGKGKILVRQFVDQRDCKNYRIGELRSSYLFVTGYYVTEQKRPLAEVLTPYFAASLKTAGYEPLFEGTSTTEKPDLILDGTIRKFYFEENAEGLVECSMLIRLAASKPHSDVIVWVEDISLSAPAKANSTELPWNALLTMGLNEAVQKFASPEFKKLAQRR